MAGRLVEVARRFVLATAHRAAKASRDQRVAILAVSMALVLDLIALQSARAGAGVGRSGFPSFEWATSQARPAEPAATQLVALPVDPAAPTSTMHRKPRRASTARSPVCVRLCDGYFFPLASASRGEAACSDLCPGAATALYFLAPGSDRIEDATAANGARYTAVDAALRYRTVRDAACACQSAIAQRSPYWKDPTLRKGDVVATANGFLAYRGPVAPADPRANFVALAQAPMPGARRAELARLERAIGPTPDEPQRPEIVAAGSSARAGDDNQIRFVERLSSVTN